MSPSPLREPQPLSAWLLFPALVVLFVGWVTLSGASFPTEAEEFAPPPTTNGSPGTDRTAALRLIDQARAACAAIRDYRCVLATRERMHGKLNPEQVLDMDFRAEPFAVHLRFREPAASVGQEVWYGVGLHAGQMRVRPAGYLGLVTGVLAMDPHAPSVRENSRHAITGAGMAHMLERFATSLAEREEAAVYLTNSVVDERPCHRLEMVADAPDLEWHRAMLHVDDATLLPVRVEYYDREGRLLDEATYRQIKRNVGLGDAAFGG